MAANTYSSLLPYLANNSLYKAYECNFFFMNRIDAPQGDPMGRINPLSSNSCS
jgi:hypothetical protein